jgi:hypothetical protein
VDERPKQLRRLVKATEVQVLRGHEVRVRFADGTVRDVDLSRYLRGPVFAAIRENPASFSAVAVVSGVLTWPNGADIDPDVLYYSAEPAWAATEEAAQA